jgi:type VI secretion system secreted protein Hcp
MAQFEMFIKIPNVSGESKKTGHEGEIELVDYSWEENNAAADGGRGGGQVKMEDFTCRMWASKASPLLFQYCAKGKQWQGQAVLAVRIPGDRQWDYQKWTFTNFRITRFSTSISPASDSLRPLDTIKISFQKLETEFTPQKDDGSPDTAVPGSYDKTTG